MSRDIVACKKTKQLYIADWATQCAIWRTTAEKYDTAERFIVATVGDVARLRSYAGNSV
jgi:myo-inositol-hexaphosphate 3-phosphohydrolase